MVELTSTETPPSLRPSQSGWDWVQALAARIGDAAADADVGRLLSERAVSEVMADLWTELATLLSGSPPPWVGVPDPSPLSDAVRLLQDWERLPRAERLRELTAVTAGLQWHGQRHWPGSILWTGLTPTPVSADPKQALFRPRDLAPALLGPLLVAATIHLHLLARSYRLFMTELGTLRTQANHYGRYALEWLAEIRAAAAPSNRASPEGNAADGASALDRLDDRLRALARAWRQAGAADAVRQVFARVLERPADAGALAGFVEVLVNGTPERQLIRELALCEEHQFNFLREFSVSQAVEFFYDHLLARPCDPYELELCMALLERGGPEAVVDFLVQGNEYAQRFGDYTVPGSGRAGCYD